jgi:polysaccharide export outer membrane protein
MSTKFWILRAVSLLSFAFATGVAAADAPLRPGDQIEMKLGGVPSTEITAVSGIYTIDGDGNVNLPHIGRVKIAGLTPGAAESTLENAYKSREIYTDPNIVITMQAQSRFVNVGGEVKFPQRVPFTPDLTILSAINAAGGFSSFADGRKVRLLRDNKLMIIDVNKIRANPSLDLQVLPGDRIEAPSIFQNPKNSQDNLQPAQQSADLASNHGTASEMQLKQAQEKLQQPQQNAELTSDQRAALEAQLKQAQDKLRQAQKDAERASNQRAALEAQLKQAQDKLQQAQQNADVGSNQRAALEIQLKQARDKLQQAQRNAELDLSQRAALGGPGQKD